MPHKITIRIRADVGMETIELNVSGCLTDTTQQILQRQIGKARTLDPAAPIEVNLIEATHIEPEALDELRTTVAFEETGDVHVEEPVRFRIPKLPQHCPWYDDLEKVKA